ncbi:hypothetical protein OG948_35720 (plasmid) [Embleya sp. NBC_00888]|uniref:hypothetical protein n=1 Tax=Embleya sp. NBC_00888 TaxID=2975960 RepID=UPI002F9138EE|nr:hypothetical protein OG948_35720 [Embleya sp. NBC_00888]
MTTKPWAHHDVATLSTGKLVTFSATNSTMRILDSDGTVISEHSTEVVTAHGITPAQDADGNELIWVADTVSGPRPDHRGGYLPWYGAPHGRILALSLDGTLVRELPLPSMQVYNDHRFEPTAVLPLPAFGQIWVSDGYGAGLIHRYATTGNHLGIAPACRDGVFNCPHAMVVDHEQGTVLVADRENNRLVALDPDGALIGTFARNLRRPSCMAFHEDSILVGELSASVAQLDRHGKLIRRIGSDPSAVDRPGWPNAQDKRGHTIAPPATTGRFNSPHGITVDTEGRAHVVEWLVGGRHQRFPVDGTGQVTCLGEH